MKRMHEIRDKLKVGQTVITNGCSDWETNYYHRGFIKKLANDRADIYQKYTVNVYGKNMKIVGQELRERRVASIDLNGDFDIEIDRR